jgi:hypothetical protein
MTIEEFENKFCKNDCRNQSCQGGEKGIGNCQHLQWNPVIGIKYTGFDLSKYNKFNIIEYDCSNFNTYAKDIIIVKEDICDISLLNPLTID